MQPLRRALDPLRVGPAARPGRALLAGRSRPTSRIAWALARTAHRAAPDAGSGSLLALGLTQVGVVGGGAGRALAPRARLAPRSTARAFPGAGSTPCRSASSLLTLAALARAPPRDPGGPPRARRRCRSRATARAPSSCAGTRTAADAELPQPRVVSRAARRLPRAHARLGALDRAALVGWLRFGWRAVSAGELWRPLRAAPQPSRPDAGTPRVARAAHRAPALALALAALPAAAQPRGAEGPGRSPRASHGRRARKQAPRAAPRARAGARAHRRAAGGGSGGGARRDRPARIASATSASSRSSPRRDAPRRARGRAGRRRPRVAELGEPPYGLDALDALQDAIAEAKAKRRAPPAQPEARRRRAHRDARRLRAARGGAPARRGRRPVPYAPDGSDRRARRAAALRLGRAREPPHRAAPRPPREAADNMAREERLCSSAEEEALRAALARVRGEPRASRPRSSTHGSPTARRARGAARARAGADAGRARRAASTRLARAQRVLDTTPQRAPALVAEVAAYRAELQAETQRAALLTERISHLSPMREFWRERVPRALRRARTGASSRSRGAARHAALDEIERTIRIGRRAPHRAPGRREAGASATPKAASRRRATRRSGSEREAKALEDGAAAIDEHIRSLEAIRSLQRARLGRRRGARARRRLAEAARSASPTAPPRLGPGAHERRRQPDHVREDRRRVRRAPGRLGAARVLSHLLGRLVRHRSGAAEGARERDREPRVLRLPRALLPVLARTVNIPLTAFALAGGALAVGIGFGSQNVVNNFISGLILLTERPIQIGDIIEIDGTQGQVERIGPRSTRIKTFEGIHLIIPNSAFLEKNVAEPDAHRRHRARAGRRRRRATAPDPRAVEEILERVLRRAPAGPRRPGARHRALRVRRERAPVQDVLLGARRDACAGRSRATCATRSSRSCAKAGIELAHPQRDVHLDARRAVPVRLVPADRDADPEKG